MRIIPVKNVSSFAKSTVRKYDKKAIEKIIAEVEQKGDLALRKFEAKFGAVKPKSFIVSKKEIEDAYKTVTKDQIDAIKLARLRLTKTELALKRQLKKLIIVSDGTKITKSFVPLDTVGCYVPGGLARY
ncbi:MAG: histidinol dehydrogenase, partial [Candidatus Nitrosotenuis sp.]